MSSEPQNSDASTTTSASDREAQSRPLASLKIPLIAAGGAILFILATLWIYTSAVEDRAEQRETQDASLPPQQEIDYTAKVEAIGRARKRPPVPQGVDSAIAGVSGAFESARRRPGEPIDPMPEIDLAEDDATTPEKSEKPGPQ